MYFGESGRSLFQDLSRYGLRAPKYTGIASAEADHISHQNWAIFYLHTHAAAFRSGYNTCKRSTGRRWSARETASMTTASRSCAPPARSRRVTPSRRSGDDLLPFVDLQGRAVSSRRVQAPIYLVTSELWLRLTGRCDGRATETVRKTMDPWLIHQAEG